MNVISCKNMHESKNIENTKIKEVCNDSIKLNSFFWNESLGFVVQVVNDINIFCCFF